VEETIRSILEGPLWQTNPVQFLVLDLSLVAGVDMSSAEAFVRIHRFLSAKCVTLVFCGFSAESAVGKALDSVQVLNADGVELFSTFNDAMECGYIRTLHWPGLLISFIWSPLGTENVYLRTWFMSQKYELASSALGKSYILFHKL
jgi:SulP family sulfate permease